jgi:hypothetical protein
MLTDDYWLTTKKNLDEPKEIKVKIPIRHLVKLHYLKIARGREISASVVEALTEYFERESLKKATSDVPVAAQA